MRKISRTNPIPPGTQNVPVNMPASLAESLSRLAKLSGMSRSRYCAHVLNEAAEQGRLLSLEIRDVAPSLNDSANSAPASAGESGGKKVSYLPRDPKSPHSSKAPSTTDKIASRALSAGVAAAAKLPLQKKAPK